MLIEILISYSVEHDFLNWIYNWKDHVVKCSFILRSTCYCLYKIWHDYYNYKNTATPKYLHILPNHLHTKRITVYGNYPLCIRKCLFKWLWKRNDFLQTSQEYGYPPLCMRWCITRARFIRNDLLHTSQ
jgi:hypothetical protein